MQPFINDTLELNTYRLTLKYSIDNKMIIFYKLANKEIGEINLQFIDELNKSILLSFYIDDSFSGIGLATEAIREVLRYLFMEFKADIIKVSLYPYNEKALRVLIKNNFKKIDSSNFYEINRTDYYNKKEKVQLFDMNAKALKDIFFRGEKFIDGKYIGVVDIIIYNTKYDKFLMTKRDLNKETYPGYWEISGGAIDYGEDIEKAAMREVREETGIFLDKVEYKYNTLIGPMLYFTYIGYTNCELDSVVLQEKETIDYKWLTKEEFKMMYEKTDNVPNTQKLRLYELIKSL